MSTIVVEPRTQPNVVLIPSTLEDRRLADMIEMVRQGMWARDITYLPDGMGGWKHCALGLIERTIVRVPV